MRYLCLDLGAKRTGVAIGDSRTGMVFPVDTLHVSDSAAGGEELLAAIDRTVRAQLGTPPRDAGEIVLGLPINVDGSEGPAAKSARAWGARIQQRTGRTVHLHDERLTSAEADWSMARSGLTRGQKKDLRDALAAAAILRDFLASNTQHPGSGGPNTPD